MARPGAPSRRIIMLLAITALALMTIDTRGSGPIRSARETAISVTAPLRTFVAWVGSPVADTWHGAVHYDDLELENAELRQRITELEGAIERQPDIESDLRALQAATDLDFIGDLPRVTARVVSDQRTGLERNLEINKGDDDGVAVGMPVVVGEGLAGRVIAVSGPHLSTVRLITDPRMQVGVASVSGGSRGIIVGNGDGQPVSADFLDLARAQVSDDERFETSGVEGSPYPADIPVGTLSIDGDDLTIEPAVDFEKLTYVTVLQTGDAE